MAIWLRQVVAPKHHAIHRVCRTAVPYTRTREEGLHPPARPICGRAEAHSRQACRRLFKTSRPKAAQLGLE
eukprot:5927678-Pyramimonas_sp.AAC.1